MNNKVRLKGHESFSIREGWLTKGIFEVSENPRVFSEKNQTDIFGIGTNMVKSLKYWLTVSNLIQESQGNGYELSELGQLIMEYDSYMEDMFSLYLIHAQITQNTERALIWNIFFNKCHMKTFTKTELQERIKYILDSENLEYNEKILGDEISALLKTYASEEKNETPENNFTCPLVDLKLVKKVDKDTYKKEKLSISNLDPYIVYWLILNQVKERDSINIEELLTEENSVGNLLNLDKILLNEYLDILKRIGLITLNRTAGLNMMYINQRYTLREIFEIHYGREQ